MSQRIIVTGTDTDVGKTVIAAALTAAIDGCYWKPVQAGLEGGGDTAQLLELARIDPHRVLPEAYRFTTSCSPHRAAEIDHVRIDPRKLAPPPCDRPLVIEGAGGPLVPLGPDILYADLFAAWDAAAVIVARTALGTINHSLMTIESLRARKVPLLGIAFVGEPNEDSEATISKMGAVRRLGRLPPLNPLNADSLRCAFDANFRAEDFFA